MLRIAHRGASAYAPENTLEAFRKALALNADGVELDVHRCKSGELVVIHDDTLDRTTDGNGPVAALPFKEIRKLRTKNSEMVPTLEEVFHMLGRAHCFIEVKHPEDAVAAARLIDGQLKAGAPAGSLWLISFYHEGLKAALAGYPHIPIGASFEMLTLPAIHEAHKWGARAILPHYQSLSVDDVKAAQALGLKVVCWTVNQPDDIARLTAMGVDGIMSDYPDRLKA
jgi:glycerophosphoryl diester phosphodiesterase